MVRAHRGHLPVQTGDDLRTLGAELFPDESQLPFPVLVAPVDDECNHEQVGEFCRMCRIV